ncbi:MAG TPA: glycosyltransferase [Anaerolineales bacterium]|nr:glycosyltransferase [Anaerolineales bacterium]
MPTKVLDLDLEQLPPVIADLVGYPRALALLRWRGKPVGQVILDVHHDQITRADVLTAVSLLEEVWMRVDRLLLYEILDWDEVDVLQAEPPRATVAVCTRDRPEDLHRCLEALIRLPDDGQEILVVDNNPSTDETYQVVMRYGEKVRYIREDQPGLDIARNRALREAKYELIAFNDDDAVPDPGWLRALVRNFRDPAVMCVTGLTMPFELETEAQEWFERYSPFSRGFQRKVYDWEVINPVSAVRVGVGANMAVRRSVLDLVGPFNEALDTGTPTRSGGDVEMFARILRKGYRIVYDPAALSWHRHRRSWEDLRKALYGYGVGVYATFTHNLLYEWEFFVLVQAINWFVMDQFPNLLRGFLHRPDSLPLDLVVTELTGCLAGPWAYVRSRKAVRRKMMKDDKHSTVGQRSYTNP